ncbi:ankyrin repeat-containing domain protein [Lactarius pseudohatsudake]|nr:ankyrin repeat-containing domain protein [Lactarius pseudohatsudake]
MGHLFDPDKLYFSAWVQLYDIGHSDWVSTLKSKIHPGAATLYYAALCGFHEIVERLAVKYPQYGNVICGNVGTALHSASIEGHVEVVRSLLKCGVDVDPPGLGGVSPLQLASREGHLDVVRYLLDHGADAHFKDDHHWTPLGYAARFGRLEVVRVLLEHNAGVDDEGLSPIHVLFSETAFIEDSRSDCYPRIVGLLLEHGTDPNGRDRWRRTPLHVLSTSGLRLVLLLRLEIARVLLAHGADVGAEDGERRTPLQVALACGQDEIVRLLSDYCSK